MRPLILLASLPLLAVACKDSSPEAPAAPQAVIAGHCVYANPFSKQEECREYHGSAWTEAAVTEDCRAQSADFQKGPCGYAETLGSCVLEGEPDKVVHVVMPGKDASLCSNQKLGCEVFAGGAFVAAGVCADGTETPVDPNAPVFEPPVLVCSDPLPGEPVGQSEDASDEKYWSPDGWCERPKVEPYVCLTLFLVTLTIFLCIRSPSSSS